MSIPELASWTIFGLGLATGLLCAKLWRGARGYVKLRRARAAVEALNRSILIDPRDQLAYASVQACKQRLRWQRTLNPNWLKPLSDEMPILVRDIAAIYYPDAEEPLWAPGLSHFVRAIHLAAADLADFLQTHRVGKLVDISANKVWKGWEVGRKVVAHEQFKKLHKWYGRVYPWYKKALPMWQAVRYQSPWMWAGFALSNVTVRTLQPIIIDIIARRAIELYSGRLALQATKTAED